MKTNIVKALKDLLNEVGQLSFDKYTCEYLIEEIKKIIKQNETPGLVVDLGVPMDEECCDEED